MKIKIAEKMNNDYCGRNEKKIIVRYEYQIVHKKGK